jgi:hypothetical protein
MSILKSAQRELSRHSWEQFVDNPPSIAQGGKGVVVTRLSRLQQNHQHNERFY